MTKLAFNTWVYSGFPVWVPSYPLEEAIKRLTRIGYDGIEIGAAAPHAFPDYLNATRRREIRQVLDGEGIAVSSMLPAPGGGAGHFRVKINIDPFLQHRADTRIASGFDQFLGETVLFVGQRD